jgi:hypothetical protein
VSGVCDRFAAVELPASPELVLVEASEPQLAQRLIEAGFPVRVRVVPGEELPFPAPALLDLVEAVWTGCEELKRPSGADSLWVLLPLFPGMGWEGSRGLFHWLDCLAHLQPEAVVPFPVELKPKERRAWAELLGDEHFESVFHRQPLRFREVAGEIGRRGFPLLPKRPILSSASLRSQDRRSCVTVLATAAFLLEELGAPERVVQELWSGARWLEKSSFDLRAALREGNLRLLTGLSPAAQRWVAATFDGGADTELSALFARCVGSVEGL